MYYLENTFFFRTYLILFHNVNLKIFIQLFLLSSDDNVPHDLIRVRYFFNSRNCMYMCIEEMRFRLILLLSLVNNV